MFTVTSYIIMKTNNLNNDALWLDYGALLDDSRLGEGLTNNRIKEIVLLNEQDEYLTYFPEDEVYFTDYINSYQNMIWHMETDWMAYNNIIDQKEFALHVKDFAYAPVLFMAKRQGQNAVNVFADMTPNQRMNIFNKFLE